MSLSLLAFLLTFIAYIAAGTFYTQQFFKQSSSTLRFALPLLMLALVGHLIILVLSIDAHSGEQLSLSFVAAMLAWLVTLTMLITNRFIKNLLFLPVVCFVSAFFITLEALLPPTTGIDVNMGIGMVSHILLSLIAFGVLSISMLYACQLAFINYQLKHKSRTMLTGNLPPLMSVEHILYQLMGLGAAFLAIALISGFVFVPNMLADGYAHKTLLSSMALACYLACIVLHKTIGLKARITVIFNFVGLLLLSLGYFGSRLVKELLLN